MVGSQNSSDAFLWDMRRLVADKIAYDYVGGLREVSNKHNLTTWLENYGHWGFPGEFLMYGGQTDELGGEFWSEGTLGDVENRAATSAGHIYGKSKKNVEDYILKNQNKNYFKCGIARIFNTTGKNQKRGNFVPDMVDKIKKNNKIFNVNEFRDFIHIDDVCKSLEIILIKNVTQPVNVSSGKKINLIAVCKKINKFFIKKKNLKFDKEKGKDLFENNNYLKKLGMTKFKNIDQIIKAFKY